MPHSDRENMRPACGELAGVGDHAVDRPTAGAEAGNEVSIFEALLSNAVRDEMVVAEGELEGDQCNWCSTQGGEGRGGAGQVACRPARNEHYIGAFGVAREQLRWDGSGAGSSWARGIDKDSGTTGFPVTPQARDNELDSLVMIQRDKPADGRVEAASAKRVRPRIAAGGGGGASSDMRAAKQAERIRSAVAWRAAIIGFVTEKPLQAAGVAAVADLACDLPGGSADTFTG